uniref:Uncharacterized protein n=1 Tax=Oryza rufipogon TaxID=4529 RepID=A0A0E0PGK1_ORYRU
MATAAPPAASGARRLGRPRAGLRVGAVAAAEGPSCLYVGPIETASQEMLEALYHQARDSYYSGQPLIVDDMFDKVELKLRVYGSPSVVKYPRCSLKRQSTYADAEVTFWEGNKFSISTFDLTTLAILSTYSPMFRLAFGCRAGGQINVHGTLKHLDAAALVWHIGISRSLSLYSKPHFWGCIRSKVSLVWVNDMVLIGLGYLIGYPISSASVGALQGLLTNNLVALKGSCPNCGEQVFAFVKTDNSIKAPHRAECHVCSCPLEYRTKVEKSLSGTRRTWVYGRVYLVKQGHPRKRKWFKD